MTHPPLTRPKAVLFDVYDTLFLNAPSAWGVAFDSICREQGLPISGIDLWQKWKRHEVRFREVRTNMADPAKSPPFKSYEQAWAECFAIVFKEMGLAGDAVAAARRSVEHMSHRPIFPDTAPALADLSSRTRLGVFSNADEAFLRPLLAVAGLRFDFVASSESARVYKPSPFAFHHLLGSMGLAAGDAWYVGDQLFDDVLGADQVGLTTVWINRTGSPAPAGGPDPKATISDLRELAG
ncbi:MAG TPA: HAD family hydrolase, partial [Methylomirabilota bacterium]|nr:HAD family hydrolase [Methylomirabilota bacterium]